MSRFAAPTTWAKGEAITAEKLNRSIADTVRDVTVGPGLSMRRSPGGRVAITLNERVTPISDASVLLSITAIVGAANYTVGAYSITGSDVPSSGNLTASDIGTAGSGNAIGVDLNELGRTVPYNYTGQLVRGNLLRTNTTGTKVYTFQAAPIDGIAFEVTLSNTGGSNGSSTSAASYTYTATAPNGQTLGTGLSPDRARKNGTRAVATKGTGYFLTGTFHLLDAFEKTSTVTC